MYEGFEAYFYNEYRGSVSDEVLDLMIQSIRSYVKSLSEEKEAPVDLSVNVHEEIRGKEQLR